ncbi:MAG: histidine kinase [Clostridia bacterium]|nr:histidine kinase [Clostridia bacterium]
MIDWIDIFDFTLAGAMMVMMAIGIAFSAFMPALDKWNKRYFVILFSLLFLCTVTCFFAVIFWEDPSKAAEAKTVYLFQGLFLSAPVFMPTVLLLHSCGESLKSSLLFKTVTVLQVIYIILLTGAQFTDAVYCVTPDNRFIRGPLWALWMVPLVLIMILNIAGVIRRRKKLSKKLFTGLLVYLLPMTAAIVLHLFISVEFFVVFGMALLAMIMFVLILSDNIEQYAKQQQQITHQRASVMVLQMRPHFIYNTMTTIYYLCKQDADKAQQVTLDFTEYLRKNFTAIASDKTVPFADELKHTQAYLAVEQAQHEDDLFMEFDTPHTRFRVPPLTLQPLVENAVKHGLDPDGEPLHICVRTRQTNSGSEITVENDGPDFDPANDNEPHIALNNIRQRLEMMCGGKLEIAPRPGGGTVVTVTIPGETKRRTEEPEQNGSVLTTG